MGLYLKFKDIQKKLGIVCVGTGIGHRQNTRTGMFQHEILIGKARAIDRLTATAIARGNVAALCRKNMGHMTDEGTK